MGFIYSAFRYSADIAPWKMGTSLISGLEFIVSSYWWIMTKLDWKAVVRSTVSTATESLFRASKGRDLLAILSSSGEQGLTFSGLRNRTGLSSGSLDYQLTLLQDGGLVRNFLQRIDGSNEYSRYALTPLGRIVLDEFE